MHADADFAAAGEVAAKIFDLIGIDIRGVDFHRRRQIDDHRSLGAGLPDIRHRFANLKRKLGLGEAEGFRRIFILPAGLWLLFALLTDKPGGAGREGDHLGLVHAENQLAEQRRGGIVEVDGGPAGAAQRLKGAQDQRVSRLGQHLDSDILRDALFVNQLADKVEVGL